MFGKLFYSFCKKRNQMDIEEAYIQGYKQKELEYKTFKNKADTFINQKVGQKVVYLPNEWEDPNFGVVVGTELLNDQVFVVVEDAFTQQHMYHLPGTLYLADELFIKAILKLNPLERWNLSVGKVYCFNTWKEEKNTYTDSDILHNKLVQCGFLSQ